MDLYYQENVKRGNWLVNLDEEDSIDSVLDAIENTKPVALKVKLILRAKFGGRGGLGSCRLTQSQSMRLVELVKSWMNDHQDVEWSELQLAGISESPALCFCIKELAPMFPKIEVWLNYLSNSNGSMPLSAAYALQKALQNGSCLQELSLKNCILEQECMELLSQGIQRNSCPSRRLFLHDVEYHDGQQEANPINPFALALARNTTLEDVSLWSSFRSSQDRTYFELFHDISLRGQPPKWKKFSWKTNSLGDPSEIQSDGVLMDRFTQTLADPQFQIVQLHLDQCFLGFQYSKYERGVLQSLVLGLHENTSIRILSLNHNGFDTVDLQCIMDGITLCTNLVEVSLVEYNRGFYTRNYDSLDWLTKSDLLLTHPLTNLKKLWIANHLPNKRNLDDNRRNISDTELEIAILQLLIYNPMLYALGDDLMIRKRMPKVSDMLDLNQTVGPLRLIPSLK